MRLLGCDAPGFDLHLATTFLCAALGIVLLITTVSQFETAIPYFSICFLLLVGIIGIAGFFPAILVGADAEQEESL